MKIVMLGEAKKHPEVLPLLTEDVIINPEKIKEKLDLKNLQIERIEVVSGEKIVYISEKPKDNIILG